MTRPPFGWTLNVAMRRKMMPPIPDTGESPHARFKRFAKAVLAVPKRETETPEQALARLEAEKQDIEQKLEVVRRELGSRDTRKPKPSNRS